MNLLPIANTTSDVDEFDRTLTISLPGDLPARNE